MDGCCVLWWGVPATELGICILVCVYIQKILLHCFIITQMVSSDGLIIFVVVVSSIYTAQPFFFIFPLSLQAFFKLCYVILILNLNSTNLRYAW